MKLIKVIAVVALVLMVVGLALGTACGGGGHGGSIPKSGPPAPTTIVDDTFSIESGGMKYLDLGPGYYDVDISSDDGVEVQWIGGGVDPGYNSGAVTEYHKRSVPVFQSTTFKIYNPTGWFSNPTALLHLRIVKVQ